MTRVLYSSFKKSISCTSTAISNIYIYIYICSSRAVPFLMSDVTFSLSMCNIGKNGTAFSYLPSLLRLLVSKKTFFARKPTDKHATICLKPTWRELEISVLMLRSESIMLFTKLVHVERAPVGSFTASGRGKLILVLTYSHFILYSGKNCFCVKANLELFGECWIYSGG